MTKPHGKTYKIRRRCPNCGMIINDPRRFTWDHKFQTWMVEFGGYKKITYTPVPDDDYEEIMRQQLIRLAPRLGLTVRRMATGKK